MRYAQRWTDVQSGTIGSTRAHDQGTKDKQKKTEPTGANARTALRQYAKRKHNRSAPPTKYTQARAHTKPPRAPRESIALPTGCTIFPNQASPKMQRRPWSMGKHAAAAHQQKDHPTAHHRRHRPRHSPASAAPPHRQTHRTHGHGGQRSRAAPSLPPRAPQAQA